MQRLVDVADDVDDEEERLPLVLQFRLRVAEVRAEEIFEPRFQQREQRGREAPEIHRHRFRAGELRRRAVGTRVEDGSAGCGAGDAGAFLDTQEVTRHVHRADAARDRPMFGQGAVELVADHGEVRGAGGFLR